ncbi:MAG: glucose-6-phosphate dehydrogenase assembly protein OpcA [Candidatus Nanopelagicales bacterium]
MIRLEDTTGNAVQTAISAERHRLGATASGMVMTLIVLADEATQSDAAQAASFAAQEHPMRILVMVPRKGRSAPRLDAEISVGGDDGPGEVAILRMYGELANHPGSVVIPLLLTDTPVVAWWPHDAPPVPVETTIGAHAQRRITSAMTASRQLVALKDRVDGYSPGDTDLSWTQITAWRTLLATTLDTPHGRILGAEVSGQRSHAAAHLLAAWLHSRLRVPSNVIASRGPGITSVRLITTTGEICINRPDGQVAKLTRTGLPPATIALPRRGTGDLLAEELRRLDADEIYGETLKSVDQVGEGKFSLDSDGKVTVKAAKRPKRRKAAK